jgi:hypothetical protein
MKNKINSIYKQVERFEEINFKVIFSGNIIRAKKLLNIAEFFWEPGNNETKRISTNSNVYSFSPLMKLGHYSISNPFSKVINAEYNKQLMFQ